MKKILFISYDGMTDPLGQSQVIPYLAGLTKFGYQFTILSCDKPERFSENKVEVEKLCAAAGIQWVSIPYHKNPPVFSSMYDFFALKNKVRMLHKRDKYDMVHTRPGVPTLVALWMKKKYGVKFLNDVRGFWADERVDGGMWNLKNPLYRFVYNFFRRHERECMEKADFITCLTYAAKKEMLSWKDIRRQPLPIEVIPCSVDMELFDPAKIDKGREEKLRSELGIHKGDKVFSYLGSIGGWYLTDEMMRFFKMLSDKIPQAKFLFISPHRHDVIEKAAMQAGLSTDKVISKQARREEVPVLLSFSQYSLFFIKPCYSKISSSPTKHGEIMAMGIPVITNSGIGDVDAIITQYHSGYIVKEFSSNELVKITDQISEGNNPFNKDAIRKGAIEYYDLDKAVKKYSEVYAAILK